MKNLWRGAFRYRNAVTVEYAYAHSKEQARVIMCRRMARKDGVHPWDVLALFDGGDNYSIELEMEVKEA